MKLMKVLLVAVLLTACAFVIPACASVEADFSSPTAMENFVQYGDMNSADSVSAVVGAIATTDSNYKAISYRSSGCSVGCSNGCSVGCSNGCSVGCSNGCSVGCGGLRHY